MAPRIRFFVACLLISYIPILSLSFFPSCRALSLRLIAQAAGENTPPLLDLHIHSPEAPLAPAQGPGMVRHAARSTRRFRVSGTDMAAANAGTGLAARHPWNAVGDGRCCLGADTGRWCASAGVSLCMCLSVKKVAHAVG